MLRVLHASNRPLNASEVARAAGLHRGTAYNILRTLQAEGFVGYDEATRTYAVSLQILELAYGVLRRSGLIDIARPLMHAVSDNQGVSVYLSKVLGPSSILLLDWVGVARRPDPHVAVTSVPSSRGASGENMLHPCGIRRYSTISRTSASACASEVAQRSCGRDGPPSLNPAMSANRRSRTPSTVAGDPHRHRRRAAPSRVGVGHARGPDP